MAFAGVQQFHGVADSLQCCSLSGIDGRAQRGGAACCSFVTERLPRRQLTGRIRSEPPVASLSYSSTVSTSLFSIGRRETRQVGVQRPRAKKFGASCTLSHGVSKPATPGAAPSRSGKLAGSSGKDVKATTQQQDAAAEAAMLFAEDKRPIVLFDGVCNLCNKWVNFLLDWDPEGKLRFAALQSDAGVLLLQRSGRSAGDHSDIVLVGPTRAYFGVDAVVHMAERLRAPFPALAAASHLCPGVVRNAIYRTVSEYRYQIFGEADSCRLGDPNFNDRFVRAPVKKTLANGSD